MSIAALISFEEFERLPEMAGKQELIDGEVISLPPPELTHTELMKVVYDVLRTAVHPSRAWPDHTGYRIAVGWIEPDVSVSWPDQKRDEKYFVGAPMIAVEILFPGEDIERKLTLYFREGAQEVWVLDRKHSSMVVYERVSEASTARRDVTEEYTSRALELTIRLADLFG